MAKWHLPLPLNVYNLFTKEDKDASHFLDIRKMILQSKQEVKLGFHQECLHLNTSVGRSLGPVCQIEGGVKLGDPT